MARSLVLVSLIILCFSHVKAQEPYFKPFPVKSYVMDSIDEIDTIYYVDEYLWSAHHDYPEQFIFFKYRGKIHLLEGIGFGESDSLFLRDITGDAIPEIFEIVSFRSGRSGWYGGHQEEMWMLRIYDFRNRLLLLEEDIRSYILSWSNELEAPLDSIGDNEEPMILSSSEYVECYNFGYEIQPMHLRFFPKEMEGCSIETTIESTGIEAFTLIWTGEGFVEE